MDAPSWQRDALRRLYGQLKHAPAEVEELYVLCRQAHDLLEAGETPLTAQPLTTSHVPAFWNTGGAVALKSIGHAKNVNALADDQTLHFAEAGLTVVYGDNGAGKSGYGRVLKRACRARDQEDILTNAYATPGGAPSARIKYSLASAVQPEIAWQDGVAANPDLSNISVFDSKCASIHVDGKNELAYTPVPLQLLQTLADVARDIGNRLKTKKTALEGQVPSFNKKPMSREGTAVHQIILSLSPTTQAAAINSLGQMSEHEAARLEQLKRDLAADPVKEVKKLKAQKQRVEELAKLVTNSEFVLLPARADELRQLLITAKDKATAAKLAANEAFNTEPLPQAGSEVWKTLWEAARAFSTQEAYPAKPFPNSGEGEACVLCQQPLSPDAAIRLNAFEKFVQQKVQQAAEDARRAIQPWKDTIKSSCATNEALAEAVRLLRDELDQPAVCRKIVRTLTKARVRGRKLVAATDPTLFGTQRAVASVVAQLTALATNLDVRIGEFQNAADPTQRKLQENELRGLEDRVWLASILPDVEAEIGRLKKIAAFGLAMQDADTNRITRKTTEVSKALVTNTIRDAFAAETVALSIADRRLELTQEASGYGSTKFKVSLVRNPKAKVERVLSEGEHRCVALAAFLAELSTAHNRSGVIFDDPVSSLDHNYRELVAARLVKEAASGRQVIVFTHDIPFLMMLDEEARSKSLNPNYQCVNRADDRAGICTQGAPSKAQPVPEIVSKVENRLTTTRSLHGAGRLDEWSDQVKAMAGLLRDGWERASEFAVSHVVRRFSNAVHTGGLRKVTVLTDADCDDLKEGYGFCCTHCHTDPPGVNRPTPTPDRMSDEITRLRNWFESVRTRQEQKK
ncbi:MAG: AAA family ATPase [Verrucomicrobia bacterium]|nr:AAA family ATPase [Verrucomicrobiota bacterium]